MEPLVFGLVLAAALLHASWNALIKVGGDALVRLTLVNLTAMVCALPFVPFVPIPDAASWPYLLGSLAIHQFYYVFLLLSYRTGDLSHVYPLARGSAPLLVAIGAFVFAGETLSPLGIMAVMAICAAILSLAFDGGWQPGTRAPVVFALCTGVTIAAYTVSDGIGGRLAGNVYGYIVYLFLLDALPLVLFTAYVRGRALKQALMTSWKPGLLGGAFAFGAYGLVIWAMSLTPMTYVSALRETSVLVAAWIGTKVLREPFGRRRLAAAGLVAGGVVVLQFSRAG